MKLLKARVTLHNNKQFDAFFSSTDELNEWQKAPSTWALIEVNFRTCWITLEPGMKLRLIDGQTGIIDRIQTEFIWCKFDSPNGEYELPYLLDQVEAIL